MDRNGALRLVMVTLALAAACDGAPPAPAAPPWPAILCDLAAWDAASAQDRLAAARAVSESVPGLHMSADMVAFPCGDVRHEIAVFTHAASGLAFALIPGGHFGIRPGNDVAVDLDPFLIARTEVTVAAWGRIMGASGDVATGLPVTRVSWFDARDFCARAGFDLPTEVQWEWACRAGSRGRFADGDDPERLPEIAHFGAPFESGPRDVATSAPNAFGLYDMHGNVSEWCRDVFAWEAEIALRRAGDGLWRGSSSAWRVLRGGCWFGPSDRVDCTYRIRGNPHAMDAHVGFRPTLALPR